MFSDGRTKLYNTLNPGNMQGYNAIGRLSGQSYSKPQQGSGNWFENAIRGFGDNIKHRAEATGNTWGTTGAALKESGGNLIAPAFSTLFGTGYTSNESRKQNEETQSVEEENKRRLTEFANKYGYNEVDDIYDALDNAKANNDTAKLAEINNKIMPELQALTAENSKRIKNVTDSHKDYRENNFVSKQINQDPGKFLGDAITTESTMVDIAALGTGLPMGVAANAIQGGAEGVANELSENGFENFDLGRAAQNAAIGTVSGAATAGLNKGLNARMLKNGGTVLKPGGAIKNGLNKAINSSIGRGTISGAVGGAVGAGTASALSGQDIQTGLQNAISGATQGAASGAVSGGIMGTANKVGTKAINAIDNRFGTNIGDISKIGQKWTESGDDFNERLTNTLNSGDSRIGNWLNKSSESGVLNRLGNLGNRIADVNSNDLEQLRRKYTGTTFTEDDLNSSTPAQDAYEQGRGSFSDALKEYQEQTLRLNELLRRNDLSLDEFNERNSLKAKYFDDDYMPTDDIPTGRNNNPTTAGGWLKKAGKRIVEDVNKTNLGNRIETTGQPDAWDRLAQENGYNSYDEVIQRYMEANPDTPLNPRGAAGQILTWLDQNPNTPTTAGGWLKKAGQRVVEDVNNSNLGNRIKAVSDEYPDDIKNMKINDYNAYADGQAESDDISQLGRKYTGSNITNDDLASGAPAQNAYKEGRGSFSDALNELIEQGGDIVRDKNGNLSLSQKVSEAEIVETPTQKAKNPQTEVYEALTGKKGTTKTSLENKLRNEAGLKLQQQYGTIDKPTAKATNAPETLQEIAQMGFTKPADVERMADLITGSNGEVSKLVSNLVATAEPIDTFSGETKGQTLDDYIDLSIQRHGLDGIREGKAVKSQINALMKSLPSRAEGSIDFQDSATDVFKLTQLLDSEAANYEGRSGMNYGTTTPDKLRAAQVLKDVSNLQKERIYATADVKKALTPDVADNLKSMDPNNKAWADTVDNKIMNAKSVADLRSIQKPWVRAKKIIDNGYMNSVTFGGRNAGRNGIPSLTKRGIAGAVLDMTVNSKPGLRLQAKALDRAADVAAKNANNATTNTVATDMATSTTPTTNATIAADVATNAMPTTNAQTQVWDMFNRNNTANIIGRNLGERIGNEQAEKTAEEGYVQSLAATTAVDNTLESLSVPNSATMASAPMYNSVYTEPIAEQTQQTGNSYVQPTGDYWTDVIGRALSRAIDENNVEAFSTLYEMYQDSLGNLSKNNASGSSDTSQLNASQQAQLAKFDAADSAIDELETLFNNAGGGKGPIFGNLQGFAGNLGIDSGAKTYNDMAEGLVNQISAAIGKTDSLNTEGEVKRALKLIPQLTDDATTARNKLEELRRMLQTTKASYNSAYGIAY